MKTSIVGRTLFPISHAKTADQVDRATGYVQEQGQKIKQQATHLGEKASEHPFYVLLAVGAVGFTLGFLCRGSRSKA